MLKNSFIVLFLIISFSILYGNYLEVKNFFARSSGDDISVKWNVSNEDNLKLFEIERSIDSDNSFKRIGDTKPDGSKMYEFADKEAYFIIDTKKKAANKFQSDKVYYYRLKIIFDDDTFIYSEKTSPLIHKVNSVKRTWGMLKEMFR